MITFRLLRFSNAGPFPPPTDPPGPWTAYNFANTPAQNGFTELPNRAGEVVNIVNSGPPASRRVEITPGPGGNKVFLTTDSPNLDPAVGMTGEAQFSVSAPAEYGGFELRYLNGVVNFVAANNFVELNIPGGDDGSPSQVVSVSGLDNTVDVTYRLTIDAVRRVRFYRNGTELFAGETLVLPISTKPSQTFMWWGEGG